MGSDGSEKGGIQGFSVFWDGDGGRQGGRMILWRRKQKMKVGVEGHHTEGGEGWVGTISKICRISDRS